MALDYPGIVLPVVRQKHTAIIGSTRKTFFEQVLPLEMRELCKIKQSGGEDYCRLPNLSEIHFVGLDDPGKWFSSELGAIAFDEAHEMSESDVVILGTRLRQRCQTCIRGGVADCDHMPHSMMLAFNPADPGHWLQHWFFMGGHPTRFGYAKDELCPRDSTVSIGDAEFVFSRATDNPHLPRGYVEQRLAGLPEHQRRRYLEGLWEFIAGSSFFDVDALGWHQERLVLPRWSGGTQGAVDPESPADKIRFRPSKSGGNLLVWVPPVHARWDDVEGRELPEHRYVIGVDVAGGGAKGDYAAVQVVDVEEFGQVAELQVRMDPDLVAIEAYRLGRIYNDAVIAPEITGGWGHAVISALQRLHYRRLYTHRTFDRLAKRWTDKLGWDTTTKSRAVMLGTLEEVLREKEFVLRSERCLMELGTFVWPEKNDALAGPYRGVPSAQPGCHDDLVMSLAIAVYLASSMPRQSRRQRRVGHQPAVSSVTGY